MDFIAYLAFRLFDKIVPFFNRRFLLKILKIKSYFFFYLLPIRKKISKANLKLVFPEKSENEISKIIRESYFNILTVIGEFFYLKKFREHDFENIIRLTNPELISKKVAYKKGLILLSAHYGNWELTAYAVSLLCGYPFNIVIKRQSNLKLDKQINYIRSYGGNKMIEMREVKEMLKCLSRGEILAMLGDQSSPEHNVRVRFFGYDVPFFEGVAALALRSGAPILFGVSRRRKDYIYEVELEEIKTLSGVSIEENVRHIIQQYASRLEFYIRENPSLWLWFHRRFKTLISY